MLYYFSFDNLAQRSGHRRPLTSNLTFGATNNPFLKHVGNKLQFYIMLLLCVNLYFEGYHIITIKKI